MADESVLPSSLSHEEQIRRQCDENLKQALNRLEQTTRAKVDVKKMIANRIDRLLVYAFVAGFLFGVRQ